jgi:hypothetical protein
MQQTQHEQKRITLIHGGSREICSCQVCRGSSRDARHDSLQNPLVGMEYPTLYGASHTAPQGLTLCSHCGRYGCPACMNDRRCLLCSK